MPGSLPSKPLLIVGVVSVALVFVYWLTGQLFLAPHDRPVDVPTSAPTSVSPAEPIATSTANIIAQRDKLDREVWSDELLAEQYETPIVQLWDTLRAVGDKLQVLAEFPLRSIVVGQWMSASQLDYGIEVSQLASSDKTMTGVEWLDFIQRYKGQGYRLVQSEWHHARFEQSRKGACPRSTVAVSLHVTNSRTEERVVIKGDLVVDWLPRTDDARPRVDHIDASRLKVYRCTGKPAFRLAATLSSRLQDTTDFMAAYDLNKDGLSEIVFGNRIFWNGGNGQFAASPLSDHRTRPLNSAVLADFNGDGQVDLFTADPNLRPQLFLADDEGRFTSPPRDVRVTAPLEGFSTSISAGDVDGDRDLDIWLTQYKRPYLKGQMPTPYYDANDGFASYLLVNDGNGEFRDATSLAGLSSKRFRRTYSSSLVDLDDDLDLDLLVVSDFAGVDVYANDGLGRFQDVTSKWVDQPHNFGMSHTIDDFDGDGRLDFYVTGMGSTTARRLDFMQLSRPDMQQHAEMRRVMGYGNRLYLRRDDRLEALPWSSEQLARIIVQVIRTRFRNQERRGVITFERQHPRICRHGEVTEIPSNS